MYANNNWPNDEEAPVLTNGEQSRWPIYLLADYNNSGVLLEVCRSLFQSDNNNQKKQPNSSLVSHQLAAGSFKDKKPKLRDNIDAATTFYWWQLIGKANKWQDDDAEIAQRVAQLTLLVYDQVRPFIEYSRQHKKRLRTRINQAAQVARQQEATNQLAAFERTLAKSCRIQSDQYDANQAELSRRNTPLAWPTPRLANIGRTFSLELRESAGSSKNLHQRLDPMSKIMENNNKTQQTYEQLDRLLKLAKESSASDAIQRQRLQNLAKFLEQQDETTNHNHTETNINHAANHAAPRSPAAIGTNQVPLPHAWSRLASRRGRYGESLVHILLVGHTNEHLMPLVLLLRLWPHLLADTFESQKFRGLGALHLAVAYDQQRDNDNQAAPTCSLLQFLLSEARRLSLLERVRDQRVSGSLFELPYATQSANFEQAQDKLRASSSALSKLFVASHGPEAFHSIGWRRNVVSHEQPAAVNEDVYWCDRQLNWPAVRGHAHLLLANRMQKQQQQQDITSGESTGSQLPVYLGDSALAWSVTLNSRACFETLLEAGADLNGCDQAGNTSLHLVIVNRQLNWARFLVKAGARTDLRDSRGFTPFLLAARLGQLALFNELLDLSAVEFWSYSMIRCCGYPLTSLDSIQCQDPIDAKQPQSGVLVLLESPETSDQQKAQLLTSPVVERLLQEKWHLYARRLFYRELLVFLLHLFAFTLANSLRPLRKQQQQLAGQEQLISNSLARSADINDGIFHWLHALSQRESIRYLSELATFSLSCRQMWRYFAEWFRYANVRLQWAYNPLAPNVLMANTFVVCCGLVRFVGLFASLWARDGGHKLLQLPHWLTSNNSDSMRVKMHLDERTLNHDVAKEVGLISEQQIRLLPGFLEAEYLQSTEEVLLVFASPLLWSGLFFFIAAYKVTGPFVAMIRYMIVRDLRQFSLIYLIFLCSFAQCIFYINRPTSNDNNRASGETSDNNAIDLWLNYVRLWLDLFKMTLGVYELEPFRNSVLARLLLLLFIYLIPILFNMLIAMMNNTYSVVINQSERAWSFQWARTLIALERSLPKHELATYQRLYSINMASQADNAHETASPAGGGDGEQVGEGSQVESGPKIKRGDDFKPGLMIIRRMSFTQAERKRLVLGYWKVSRKYYKQQAAASSIRRHEPKS